jgi:hypothetical protein
LNISIDECYRIAFGMVGCSGQSNPITVVQDLLLVE